MPDDAQHKHLRPRRLSNSLAQHEGLHKRLDHIIHHSSDLTTLQTNLAIDLLIFVPKILGWESPEVELQTHESNVVPEGERLYYHGPSNPSRRQGQVYCESVP